MKKPDEEIAELILGMIKGETSPENISSYANCDISTVYKWRDIYIEYGRQGLIGSGLSYSSSALVVDDEEPVRKSLKRISEKFFHRVDTAENGIAAIVKLKTSSYDYIFVDFNMPGMTGDELIRTIRSENLSNGKILLITAKMSESVDKKDAVEHLRIDTLVRKPFNSKSILSALIEIKDR